MEKRKKIQSIDEFLDSTKESDFLFEMANYGTKVTGLPMMIWVGSKGKAQHGPRIKVQRNYIQKMDDSNLFVVSVSDDPKIVAGDLGEISNNDLKKVFEWIKINKILLLSLWNLEVEDFDEFVKQIKKI